MNWKCFFGIHKWKIYKGNTCIFKRKCIRCNVKEEGHTNYVYPEYSNREILWYKIK